MNVCFVLIIVRLICLRVYCHIWSLAIYIYSSTVILLITDPQGQPQAVYVHIITLASLHDPQSHYICFLSDALVYLAFKEHRRHLSHGHLFNRETQYRNGLCGFSVALSLYDTCSFIEYTINFCTCKINSKSGARQLHPRNRTHCMGVLEDTTIGPNGLPYVKCLILIQTV